MRKYLPTCIITLIFLIGLALLLYPTVSDYVNTKNQSHAITEYTNHISRREKEQYEEILQKARTYNDKLASHETNWILSGEELDEYNQVLDIGNNGMMGYIEIPKIQCRIPIYHGIDEGTLQKNIGHLPGSSLPVGGESTHCVLTGHRGLPSAKLFSDLDKLTEGDRFVLHVLNETLIYEVDQIMTVLPDEVDALQIEEGKDLCTLVTCTPYGVNSHRLLVRGRRIGNEVEADRKVMADGMQMEPVKIVLLITIPVVLVLLALVLISDRKRRNL